MRIFVLLAAAGVSTATGAWLWWIKRRRDEASARSLPPLFFPLSPTVPQTQQTHVNGNGAPLIANVPLRRADTPVFRPVAVEPPRMKHRPEPGPRDSDDDAAETVRFVRTSDESVQLLPGRLEVVEGATPHREIRFVRVPGEPPQVILGREGGLSPHYIGLGSPTVSRRHARFDFADNRWVVKNLSRTNPLIVNDDELFDTDVARPLADGDRLELGEIVLRFHAQ